MKNIWKVCAGVEEEGENQEVYVKTLANQTCSGELFLLDNYYDDDDISCLYYHTNHISIIIVDLTMISH